MSYGTQLLHRPKTWRIFIYRKRTTIGIIHPWSAIVELTSGDTAYSTTKLAVGLAFLLPLPFRTRGFEICIAQPE